MKRFQTTSSGSDERVQAELDFGPTPGHKSGTFVGGEAGFRLLDGLYVIIEGSHMVTRTMIIVGFGANVPFATRLFADLGYRYGRPTRHLPLRRAAMNGSATAGAFTVFFITTSFAATVLP